MYTFINIVHIILAATITYHNNMIGKQPGEPASKAITQEEVTEPRVNLEADIFGAFDTEYADAARTAQMTAEEERVDVQTRAERAGQLRDAFLALDAKSTRDALSLATAMIAWIPEGKIPEQTLADLKTLEQLHEKLHQREAALPKDAKEALEKLRTLFFNNPKVTEISERLVRSLKEAGSRAHGDVAIELQTIADAAFAKGETARALIEQYPELGEVYEAGSDTIENAKRITHDRMVNVNWNDQTQISVNKDNTYNSWLPLKLVKINLERIREARKLEEQGKYNPELTLYVSENQQSYVNLNDERIEYLEKSYQKAEGTTRAAYLVGTRSYERLMSLLDGLPTRTQRHVLEQQLGVEMGQGGMYLRSLTSSREVRGIEDVDLQIRLLREFKRASVLRSIVDWMSDPTSWSIKKIGEGYELINEYRDSVTNGDDETSRTHSQRRIEQGHGAFISFPKKNERGNDRDTYQKIFAQIFEKDPEFFEDVVSVISILKRHGHMLPDDSLLKNFPQTADKVPYLTEADRDTQVKQYKKNIEIAASFDKSDKSTGQGRELPRVIFTAEQGAAAVKAVQLESLRALAEEQNKLKASEQRALVAERELAALNKQLTDLTSKLSNEEKLRQAAERAMQSVQVAATETGRSGDQKIGSLSERIAKLVATSQRTTQRDAEIRSTLITLQQALDAAKKSPGITGGNAKKAVEDALPTLQRVLTDFKEG